MASHPWMSSPAAAPSSSSWLDDIFSWVTCAPAAVIASEPSRSAASVEEEDSTHAARVLAAKDFFAVLDVSPYAKHDELVAAYKKLMRVVHPDKCREPNASEAFAKAKEAYAVLADPTLHAQYTYALATGDACTWHSYHRDGRVAQPVSMLASRWMRLLTPSFLCSRFSIILRAHVNWQTTDFVPEAKRLSEERRQERLSQHTAAHRAEEKQAVLNKQKRDQQKEEQAQVCACKARPATSKPPNIVYVYRECRIFG